MAVSTETNEKVYNGNGVTTIFAYDFLILEDTDLQVIETVTATGVSTTKTLNTHYTVSGAGTGSGSVTMVTAPASGVTLTIRRVMPLTQEIDYNEADSFPAETHERGLDKAMMVAQDNRQRILRTLRQPDGDVVAIDTLPTKVDRASKYLGFDADGDPIAVSGTTEANPVSVFMATVLDDTDGDAVIETVIGDMTEETAPAAGDLLPVSDVSAGDGRKITLENMLKVVNGLTEDVTPDPNADFILTYDASASAVKKVKPSNVKATDSIPGVVELATTDETKTGTDTERVVTPAGLKGAIGFSKYSESSLQAIGADTAVSFAHGLGVRPVFVYVYLECVTAELGYSVGDHIPITSNSLYSTTTAGATVIVDSTNVRVVFDNTYVVMNPSTFIASVITFANWKVGFRAWA